ncbi:hypothetical protein [Brachybacterium sp. YJGR34]|uniref:hypothetical protein n=1 Tax=Brachybacterium sp. YJGR34 TaxID=2059911 RepID=UPI000E0A27F3|nr:hypothetical protein [Brachybacterium sp. YJGR34]
MRFERIFDDLEGRFAHHEQEEMRAVSEDLTRAERAQLTLADRLRGAGGRPLILHVGASLRLSGAVADVGEHWVALTDRADGRRAVVPLAGIGFIEGLPTRARPAEETLRSALGLGSILREIARDRSVVRVETTAGGIVGRIAAVGADAVDVHSLPTGEATAMPGSQRLTVAMSALLAVLPR